MELIKVRRNYQVTIPQGLRKKLHLSVGDYVEADLENGRIVIRPVKVVHTDEEYFHTTEWQDREAEADRDIVGGDVLGPYENTRNAIRALKKAKV